MRAAALTISVQTRHPEQASGPESLPLDIWLIFRDWGYREMAASKLVEEVGLTPEKLAEELKDLSIRSHPRARCDVYRYAVFKDIFDRYLPPSDPSSDDPEPSS